ncbi:hypothetical protein QOZ80_9BG0693640 [Eleusine coracana subsp. coracana]|nr:hypothetical protein QOZ80_9BG0693640 [Eleusine coracana subsp. coracana]
MQVDSHAIVDSEAENDDLYLSNCRISLVGFDDKEMLRLVMMIRNGGGSRHILLSERLTHIVLGAPSDDEKREVRRLASWGIINVVKVTWLEDCTKSKKEVKVSPIHVATDLVLKDFSHVSSEKSADTRETKVAKSLCGIFHVPTVNDSHGKELEKDMSSERNPARGNHASIRSSKSSNVFKGKTFGFSNSFSHDKRPEVVDWVREGGATFLVTSPVQLLFQLNGYGFVCMWDTCKMLEIILSSLLCAVTFRSLGVKYTVKASKKVTHHICKFAIGQMYEIYCKRGIPTITAEWLFECVKQDAIVPFDDFQPKPLTSQDKDAGLYTASQYSTQGARFDCSQLLSGCQVTRSNPTHKSGVAAANEESCPPAVNKRRKLSVPSKAGDTRENIGRTDRQLHSSSVPDVADAIEVLSSKIQDVQSPRSIFEPDNSAIVQEQKDAHSFGISRNWLNMQQKQDNTPDTKVHKLNSSPTPSPVPAPYYPFSETQTESQIVIYEEDLSGRQKIIDRVRSQSINATPSNEMP